MLVAALLLAATETRVAAGDATAADLLPLQRESASKPCATPIKPGHGSARS